jgi:potassium-dependent mechanosensitive channel
MQKIILVFLLFVQVALFSQENAKESPPDPSQLSPDWWEFFQDDKAVIQERAGQLTATLEETLQNFSEENREEAHNLVDQIKVNLQTWVNILDQPLPQQKPPSIFRDSYTLDAILELHNLFQKQAIDLKAKQQELNNLQQQLNTNREQQDLARKKYLDAEEHSPEKILQGLLILKIRPAIEVGIRKIALLEKSIAIEKNLIKETDEEIKTAKKRLVADPSERSLYARQVAALKSVWDDFKKDRQRQEIIYAENYVEEPTPESETANNLQTLQLTEASLKEIEAHINYIKGELLYQISELILESDGIEIQVLDRELRLWNQQIQSFERSLKEWTAQTERILKRAVQVMSLAGQDARLDRGQLEQVVSLAQSTLLLIQKVSGEIEEVKFLLSIFEGRSLGLRGQGERWIKVVIDFIADAWMSAGERLNKTLFYIGTHPVSFMTLVEFLLIMIMTWWLSRLITGMISTFSQSRKGIRKALIYRLNRLLHYFFLIIGALVALSWIGFDFSNLVLIAGALGVGIGFGLQNIFNNFISGIIILFQSHLKVGDYIEIASGLRGEIREINVRSTVVTTNDGIEVIIPNSEMVSNRIVNWTLRDPYRRIHVPFTVAYGTDLDEVSKLIIEAAKKVQSTLQRIGVREPQIFLMKLGDHGIEMELVVWVDEKWARRDRNTRSQYLYAIEKTLKEHGIAIPYPQHDLHITSVLGEKDIDKLNFPK